MLGRGEHTMFVISNHLFDINDKLIDKALVVKIIHGKLIAKNNIDRIYTIIVTSI